MLIFSDWIIKTDGDLIARQYDNLTRELLVMGTLPEGWAWDLLVQAGGSVNVIALSPRKGGVGVTLTAEMLTKAGLYALQLRGGKGEEVRHTNVIQVVVPTSLVGDATWPELPSEFSQAEANIRELNAHPPIPGDNGYWLIWDLETGDYVESQLSLPEVSVGPQGPEGKAASIRVGSVLTGEPGSQAAVSNSGTENNAILDFVLPRGQIGPTGPSGADGRDGKDGVPGAAATIQVGAVTTGEPGTQAQVVNVGTENAAMLQFTIPRGQPGAAGVGVPEIGEADEGRVMTARSGQAVWEAAQGGGGGGVQPNWDQNDPQEADYIKNRPFSMEMAELASATVSITSSGDSYIDTFPEFTIYSGEAYRVQFGDETYQVTGKMDVYGVKYIGNLSIDLSGEAEDTGEPFLIWDYGFIYGDQTYTSLLVTVTGPKVSYIPGIYYNPEDIITKTGGKVSQPFTISSSGDIVLEDGEPATAENLVDLYGYYAGIYTNYSQDGAGIRYSGSVTISPHSFSVTSTVAGKKMAQLLFGYMDKDSAVLDCGGCQVVHIGEPEASDSAATKRYVDDRALPTFTADDEGKVLKIVNGVPTWVTP